MTIENWGGITFLRLPLPNPSINLLLEIAA